LRQSKKEVVKELFDEKCDQTQIKVGGDLVIKHYEEKYM
jgi:hypothetical protein